MFKYIGYMQGLSQETKEQLKKYPHAYGRATVYIRHLRQLLADRRLVGRLFSQPNIVKDLATTFIVNISIVLYILLGRGK